MIATPVLKVTAPAQMWPEEVELLSVAQALLGRVWVQGRCEVATALRSVDGTIYTGVHMEGSCRRSSICAEGVALGTARAGLPPGAALDIVSVVSVQIKPAGQYRIIAPCGVCRELISDYCPTARIWITQETTITVVAALDLLPYKSRRVW